MGLRVLCRHRDIDQDDDIEDLLRIFLIDCFESNEVYIISPWITSFSLNRKVIYYPYVSTYSVEEVLRSLVECGIKVYVLIRCFDDFISPELIYFLYQITNQVSIRNIKLTQDLLNYLKEELYMVKYRLVMGRKIARLGVNVRTDLGVNDGLDIWYRLHSKIYVNDKYALIGSANFTRSGIVRNGNWECLVKVPSSNPLYKDIINYAKKYYEHGRSYSECIDRVIKLINNYLVPLGIPIKDLNDLERIIDDIMNRI